MDADTITATDEDRRDALAERLFRAILAGAELLTVELGRRLGLYEAVHDLGPSTPAELAARAGIDGRYAREWPEQQAAGGILDVDPDGRFRLPEAHVPVLIDAEHPAHLLGTAPLLAGLGLTLPDVAAAFVSGGGVPYAGFGTEIRHGIGTLNRPAFAADLPNWMASMPDVARRLGDGGRVLDAGCGVGWSSIILAKACPRARVHGVDLDEASVLEARAHAVAAGVDERVTFEVADVVDVESGAYDLVCVFEALHDMGDAVGALRHLRAALAPGAPVFVADEKVADTFTAPADEVERLQYAFSVLNCLPATMAESTAVAHGTVLRTPTVRAWAAEAGYASLQVLPIENDFWRFYRLDA